MPPMLDPDIQTLVRMGDIIGAIGLYQQRHGGSTLVARKAIDAARRELTQETTPEVMLPQVSAPMTVINDSELDALLRSGQKIAAIKRYRELHGGGLKEAKDAVEAMLAGRPAEPAPQVHASTTDAMDPELVGYLRAGQKINAIKRYRELYAVGLKEAKDAVEAIQAGETVVHPPVVASEPQLQMQPELDRLILAGQQIAAIKHHRTLTNFGLKESKDFVEARMAELEAAGPRPEPSGMQPELDRLIRANQLIMAIKHYRTITNAGLKESKDAVEARAAEIRR